MKLIFTKGIIFLFTSLLFLSHCKSDPAPGPMNGNESDPAPGPMNGNESGETPGPMNGNESGETPGITYAQPDNSPLPDMITLAEGYANVDYEYMISLNTQPSDDVMIQISLPANSPDNLRLSSGGDTADMANESITLTFTNTDWNSAQTVTLTLADDDVALGNVDVTIDHASGSSDSNYNSIPVHNLIVTTEDNEMPTVTIPATLAIDEGNSGVIMVSISHEPAQNVEITLTKNSDEASISPDILTFTPGNWNVPKMATITIQDNDILTADRDFTVSYVASTINEMNPYHGVSISNTTVTIVEDETTCTQPGAGAETDFIPDMPGENYGAGNQLDPHIICNAMQLQFMSDNLGAHYELGKDIDASSIDNFIPIGGADTSNFTGTLDGKGFIISNLMININLTSGFSYAGLFGTTSLSANIRNIGLLNVNITSSSSSNTYTDFSYAGGLVGSNSATITNCYSTGNISSSSPNASDSAGGLVGINNDDGIISNSYSTGNVSSSSSIDFFSSAGGLVGFNNGSISNSYSTENTVDSTFYTGGLVGINNDSGGITNSYSTGIVSSSSADSSSVGGVVGFNKGSITNSYYDQETSGPDDSIGTDSGTLTCVAGLLTSEFTSPTEIFIPPIAEPCEDDPDTTMIAEPLKPFFNWYTPFDIDGDSTPDEESVRYDSNNDGMLDAFIWNFGTTSEYPFIASIPKRRMSRR